MPCTIISFFLTPPLVVLSFPAFDELRAAVWSETGTVGVGIMAGTTFPSCDPSFPVSGGGIDWKLVPAASVEAVMNTSSVDNDGVSPRGGKAGRAYFASTFPLFNAEEEEKSRM